MNKDPTAAVILQAMTRGEATPAPEAAALEPAASPEPRPARQPSPLDLMIRDLLLRRLVRRCARRRR